LSRLGLDEGGQLPEWVKKVKRLPELQPGSALDEVLRRRLANNIFGLLRC
jgi:hypothetical protein